MSKKQYHMSTISGPIPGSRAFRATGQFRAVRTPRIAKHAAQPTLADDAAGAA